MPYEQKLDTVQGLNFWEELAGMYNRGLVDDEIVVDYFGAAALDVWSRSRWFVCHLRHDSPNSMAQFEQMCKTVAQRRQAAG